MKPLYEKKSSIVQSFESMNLEFPEHLHDHGEILLVLEGSLIVRIMDKSRELRKGDCAVIFPQHIHSYHAPADSRTIVYIFNSSLTGMYARFLQKYTPTRPFLSARELTPDGALALDRLYTLSCTDRASCPEEHPVLKKLYPGRKLSPAAENAFADTDELSDRRETALTGNDELPDGRETALTDNGELPDGRETALTDNGELPDSKETAPPANSELCSAWFQLLFALVWPRLAPAKKEKSASMELPCQLVQYMTEHFQDSLTLELLARELHVNKYYISNIFSRQLQLNFRRYLNHLRLEYAAQLIKTSSLPLTDVWAAAGFNSQRSFNRAFMEIMGMTPTEYRKAGNRTSREETTAPAAYSRF